LLHQSFGRGMGSRIDSAESVSLHHLAQLDAIGEAMKTFTMEGIK
jgi:hypothetical protein